VGLGPLDLALEQLELLDEQFHLEADLPIKLRRRDRPPRGGVDHRSLRRADRPAAGGADLGQVLGPPGGRRAGRRGALKQGDRRSAGGILVRLAKLGEADIDEPQDPLADPGLLLDQGHREARGFAELRSGERLPGPRSVDHGECGEGTRVGGIRLGPLQPALGEVLRADRADHRDRDAPTGEVAGDREPIVPRGLQDRALDRAARRDERIEPIEPGAVGRDPQHGSLGFGLAIPTDRDRVLVRADVDPQGRHARHLH